jgi:CRP-like cAMP-binding protein
LRNVENQTAFLNLLNKAMNLDKEKSERILEFVHYEYNKKNTDVVRKGSVCENFYFILRGSIRLYYSTENGKIKTRLVLFENEELTALLSFITGKPSMETIEALEDSCFAVISRDNFLKLVKEIPEWSAFYTKLLEKTYVYQNNRLEQLATMSAVKRYQKLLKEYPHYVQRLSSGILASYLDISPETLSRVKSK